MIDNKNRNPSVTAKSVAVKKPESFFAEQPPQKSEMAPARLHRLTRRDVLLFGAGAVAALSGAGFLLPQNTLSRLGVAGKMNSPRKEWFLNQALRIDDDVAEALYSEKRMVPTYTKSQITDLKNNYNGATPDPGYISGWNLTLDGLASGLSISLDIRNLMSRFSLHVSIDLATGRHPQTLLATHFNGQPLTVDHGAPLRLLAPVKLGLKNVKAITKITYSVKEPKDYWAERGYSRYDGI